jgi:putative transposase
VTWAIKDKSYSQRRACALVGLQAKTYRYASKRSDDAPIRHRLLELAQQRRRSGYRRLHLLLRREGVMLNHKKLYRLYREERLMVRKRGGRKRAIRTRAPMALPQGPNQRWSLDFVSDALACGRKFRVLAVVDDRRVDFVMSGLPPPSDICGPGRDSAFGPNRRLQPKYSVARSAHQRSG